jgi:hypothetical protein
MKGAPIDLLATLLADVEALEGAACAGTAASFVDVTTDEADELRRAFCWHCIVVGRCREVGDHLAPHAWPSLYGARLYATGEPAEGWPEDGAA